ncbi:porin [Candidatus Colwellia aromaticivorans]|uniref:porin n=1 Tax=Candidatus Colwellia aromaticivorans TaxID=2267621 RepID=UPI000DF39900|nr:porin [Candidatus Colwellia aromaticivorans]
MTTKFKLAAIALACTTAFNASAAVELYNNDEGMTFTADGLINIFYSSSDTDMTDDAGVETNSKQARVRTGFLPSYIGLNSSNKVGDYTVATRSSFWVSLSDPDVERGGQGFGTHSQIDIRQFYATVSGDFGEVLLGKDFGLFNRSNIFGDELLLGYGQTSNALGLVDGGNVSFGNIATGYTYAFPKAQITYRTPDMSGFKLAVGIMDPNKVHKDSDEDMPRFEAELTYDTTFDGGSVKGWVNGMSQSSEYAGADQDQSGVGYGVNVKFSGVSLTASGFDAEGVGHFGGLDHIVTDETTETDGYLVQASYTMGDNRFVASYGESTIDNGTMETESSNTNVSYFRTVVPGVTLVAELNKTEIDNNSTSNLTAEENNVFSIGAVVTF